MKDIGRVHGRDASFVDTLKAVASSFFGVRAGRAHRQDMARLKPLHVVVVGVMLAAAFVLALLLVVKAVVG